MGLCIIFLLMPALACGSISVHIKASAVKDQASTTFNGTDSKVISDVESESFNITTSNLKAAVGAYAGGSPLDVFIKSPTPWGDLYKTYKWSEVRRDTEVKKVKMVAVNTERLTLAKQYYNNKLTSGDSIFTANMKANVVNYVKNSFHGKKVSVNAEYNVDLVMGWNPPMHMKLVSHLETENELVKDTKTIQAESEVKFTLKPSQSAKSVLNATKVTMNVSIDYESSLSGYVAANYNPRYKGHHFWAYDVKDVINSTSSMSPIQKGTDLVTIQYFTDAFVYVTDQDSGHKIVSVPADYVI